MVHLASSGGAHRPSPAEMGAPPIGVGGETRDPVKLEIVMEDELEEENAPLNKRIKHLPSDQLIAGNDLLSVAPSEYNPLNEPSPLGLRLKKSPSLLELIQMRLSQGNSSSQGLSSKDMTSVRERTVRGSSSTSAPGLNDKLKASNFPASLLRIGQWEYASTYEGDLVAKCYFAKHKLVWEVLDGALKSKIEIQWSDIMGLNAKFPEDGPATLTVVLARQPLFFRETNPQPRKHTLWQATADFTDNQASMHRQHFLQVPLGVLNKHFEKLIQCDMRLNYLSCQPEIVLDSPYFESFPPDLEDSKVTCIHTMDPSIATNLSTFHDGASPSVHQNSPVQTEQESLAGNRNLLHEAPSPSSVTDTHAPEGCVSSDAESLAGRKNWEQVFVQGLRPSMSMTDLVNHIGSCISGGQGNTENPSFAEDGSEPRKILEDIAQHLLGDSQVTCSDEKSLMTRVNSLCSLLHKEGTPAQLTADNGNGGSEEQKESSSQECKPAMSRKDSYGDLLLNLPRIASLPKFLFDISEDGENQAR